MSLLYNYICTSKTIDISIVKYYIEHDDDKNRIDENDMMQVYLRRSDITFKVFKLLVAYGGNLHFDKGILDSPLSTFLANKHMKYISSKDVKKIIKLMLNKGIDINKISRYGLSPFMYYIRNQIVKVDMLNFLIKNGADITKKIKNGNSILHIYLSNNSINFKIVKYLIEMGLDPGEENKNGCNSIDVFIRHNNYNCDMNILSLLFSKVNYDIYKKSDVYMSALDMFLEYSDEEADYVKSLNVINFILSNISINERDRFGKTPIMYATCNKTFFRYFIKLGSDINVYSDDGITCGSLAIINCDDYIFDAFIHSNLSLETIEKTFENVFSKHLYAILNCNTKIKMIKKLIVKTFMLDPLFYHRFDVLDKYFKSFIDKYKKPIENMCNDKIKGLSVYDIIFGNNEKSMNIIYTTNCLITKYINSEYKKWVIKAIENSKKRKFDIDEILMYIYNSYYLSSLPIELQMKIIDLLDDKTLRKLKHVLKY
ncbi:ankyrin repeat protein [White-tailed deer poxvirus]|nr:ankyrin repeat protein [White-tailed deer poxvirus]